MHACRNTQACTCVHAKTQPAGSSYALCHNTGQSMGIASGLGHPATILLLATPFLRVHASLSKNGAGHEDTSAQFPAYTHPPPLSFNSLAHHGMSITYNSHCNSHIQFFIRAHPVFASHCQVLIMDTLLIRSHAFDIFLKCRVSKGGHPGRAFCCGKEPWGCSLISLLSKYNETIFTPCYAPAGAGTACWILHLHATPLCTPCAEQEGTRLYASCLVFWDDVPAALAAAHPQLTGARATKAMCLLSRAPFLTTMEAVRGDVHVWMCRYGFAHANTFGCIHSVWEKEYVCVLCVCVFMCGRA